MMMNRKRIGRFMAVFAVILAAFFILSSVFLGLGSNVNYNLFDLFGKQNQGQQRPQGPTPQDAVAQAQKDYKQNPKNPDAIKRLAAAYYQAGRYGDAASVLEKGRKVAPRDVQMAGFLGQVYSQEARTAGRKEQPKLYNKSGDAYAAATKIDPKSANTFLLAGQSYDQAGNPVQAIKYYNGYLDLQPKGQYAQRIKDRITALLKGGRGTSGTHP